MSLPTPSLEVLRSALHSLAQRRTEERYAIPELWCAPHTHSGERILSNPAQWFLDCIDSIIRAGAYAPGTYEKSLADTRSSWISKASMYCLLPRQTTAYNHQPHVNTSSSGAASWNCQGSFLKTIALLPYLQSIGINTLYLLPFMSVGKVSAKGNLGSIYAQSSVTTLDPMLGDDLLELSIEQQFKALVEAAHVVGMRVVVEFALRTTSRDADWILEHPDWYYWVREENMVGNTNFRPPHFNDSDLKLIAQKMRVQDFDSLPAPSMEYRELFCPTPLRVEKQPDGEFVGICADGRRCRVPGAFADYPPDDVQPLWSDVTYLRLHTHPSFNYVAYNTVRMFDSQLTSEAYRNQNLWNCLSSIIPSYIKDYNIDGAVLDMCHALPSALQARILSAARELKSDFVFIEENFETTAASAKQGFDAVLGDFWLHCSSLQECKDYMQGRTQTASPIPFLACVDTHNSPRLFARNSTADALEILRLSRWCPQGIPCILAGTEFGCTQVLNTGLGFRTEELEHYPAEQLALFSDVPMNWCDADVQVLQQYRIAAQDSDKSSL